VYFLKSNFEIFVIAYGVNTYYKIYYMIMMKCDVCILVSFVRDVFNACSRAGRACDIFDVKGWMRHELV